MRPLRYSINVTLDGCCDHLAGLAPTRRTYEHSTATIERADALILGRVTYQMMEDAWRGPGESGVLPASMDPWVQPFADAIHTTPKHVVSSTLEHVDWNAELVREDVGTFVEELKQQPGRELYVGGVRLPLALAELDLIDEYELVVHPRFAGHGPTLFGGLSRFVDLHQVGETDLGSGIVARRYQPVR